MKQEYANSLRTITIDLSMPIRSSMFGDYHRDKELLEVLEIIPQTIRRITLRLAPIACRSIQSQVWIVDILTNRLARRTSDTLSTLSEDSWERISESPLKAQFQAVLGDFERR